MRSLRPVDLWLTLSAELKGFKATEVIFVGIPSADWNSAMGEVRIFVYGTSQIQSLQSFQRNHHFFLFAIVWMICLTILSSWLPDWSSLVLSSVSEDVGIPSWDSQSEWWVNRFKSMAPRPAFEHGSCQSLCQAGVQDCHSFKQNHLKYSSSCAQIAYLICSQEASTTHYSFLAQNPEIDIKLSLCESEQCSLSCCLRSDPEVDISLLEALVASCSYC